MQLEEFSYNRNEDNTYKVVLSYKKKDGKRLSYEYPKVKINWSSASGLNIPTPLDVELVASGKNDVLINVFVEE